jgi:hypothetical protein
MGVAGDMITFLGHYWGVDRGSPAIRINNTDPRWASSVMNCHFARSLSNMGMFYEVGRDGRMTGRCSIG